jgi:hypothetical protein
MRVAYIGNYLPEHSTENHVYRALVGNEHDVIQFQENNLKRWDQLNSSIAEFDFVLWTRTGWGPKHPQDMQYRMLDLAEAAGVPTVGYHLDRWWGLNRTHEVLSEPFFKVSLLVTADGHPEHQQKFEAAGVNHHWMPPGVSLHECMRTPKLVEEYKHDVIFVGSHMEYHKEWKYRMSLVHFLKKTYGPRLGLYPRPGEHALRGQPLVDLYHSSKVVVGDSCLNGGITNYWSDRIPETIGRRGFLIHPEVEGLEAHFTPGTHLETYSLGDWKALQAKIDRYIEDAASRNEIASAGQGHVLMHHTYEVRMQQLVELLAEKGML